MSETNLEAIKEMIKNLSPEERHEILPFLAEFPDSGIHAFDLKKEFEFLKSHGLKMQRPDDEPDRYLIDLWVAKNIVSVLIDDREVLRTVFFPENFIEVWSGSNKYMEIGSKGFKT